MSWSKKLWQCPFYRSDQKECLLCEGGRLRLPISALRDYETAYCAGDWRSCTIARALLRHYDEQEGAKK